MYSNHIANVGTFVQRPKRWEGGLSATWRRARDKGTGCQGCLAGRNPAQSVIRDVATVAGTEWPYRALRSHYILEFSF